MGARANKKRRFFAAHPVCCFCGGVVPASTEDHIPARSFFLSRLWPEGYVFPACFDCNNGSSRDELFMAWVVRVRLSGYDEQAEKDFLRVCEDLARSAPEIWAAIRPHSRAETRKALKSWNMPQSIPGVADVVYTAEIPNAMLEAIERYGLKLGKALHYLHTGLVVPANAVVKSKVFLSGTTLSPMFPERIFVLLTQEVPIQRAKTSLKEQFDYRFAVVEGGAASSFCISFGQGVTFVVAVFSDPERYAASGAARVLAQPQ